MLADLDDLVEPDAKGDPMCPLRWTTKSLAKLAAELVAQGHQISTATVAELLRYMDYRLQRPSKAVEGRQHPDRHGQFRYLARVVGEFLDAGQPAVSVDAKKKELVGNHINGGVEYEPAGSPVRVDVHDFPDPGIGKAIPYGVYDLAANNAWVSVGDVHDTAEFAVASIERWWDTMGQAAYPNASKLAITVMHFPPGTSKWNKIEHRLFSQITLNWRGRPLLSHEVVVELIAATTPAPGVGRHVR